jgi:hypothetical protein
MNRPLSFLLIALFLLAACSETATHYQVDSSGKLRKIATEIIPHRNDVILTVNGASFAYNFRAIGGNVSVRGPSATELRPGEYRIPFDKLCDGILTETSKTAFSGNIRRLKNTNLKTEQLVSEARGGGETRNMLRPAGKPFHSEYRNVNGRQWLVTTRSEDPSQRIVTNQTWWNVAEGFLITFNVNFIDAAAPRDAVWRQQRLQMLAQLVSDFRYVPAKT